MGFVLSDTTNGYVYRIQIYSGKNLDSDVDTGLCFRVLLELMSDLDGHHLYTDNYYTSPEVFLALYDKGINCCGTVRVKLVKTKGKLLMDHSFLQLGMTDDMCILCPHYT